VLRSDFHYDNLVFEHVAGFGGTAARLLGDVIVGSVKKLRPSLEQHLLDKANAAIIKAAATKEVRIHLSKLLGKKK
jgi:hypothetical protein